jgi:hypothetical protein
LQLQKELVDEGKDLNYGVLQWLAHMWTMA